MTRAQQCWMGARGRLICCRAISRVPPPCCPASSGTVALGVAGTGGHGRGDVLVLVLMFGDITSIALAPLC